MAERFDSKDGRQNDEMLKCNDRVAFSTKENASERRCTTYSHTRKKIDTKLEIYWRNIQMEVYSYLTHLIRNCTKTLILNGVNDRNVCSNFQAKFTKRCREMCFWIQVALNKAKAVSLSLYLHKVIRNSQSTLYFHMKNDGKFR